MIPGFNRFAGSKIALNSPNAAIAAGEYISGRNSLRALPSPCSPDSDPPYRTTSVAASPEECPEPCGGVRQRQIQPGVHAAVTEMAVGQSRHAVVGLECLEVPQVRTQLCRRDGGVLPARPGGLTGGGPPGQPDAVLPDPPQRAGLRAGRKHLAGPAHSPSAQTSSRRRQSRRPGCRRAVSTNSQPPPPAAPARPTRRGATARRRPAASPCSPPPAVPVPGSAAESSAALGMSG